jgi:hypothetical protein
MVLLNRNVDSSEGIEDNSASLGRQNLHEGQEPEEKREGDTPDYLLMAPSKLPQEHTLRPEDTRFWKRIDPRKLFPDQEEESEEEWVEACENAPWEVSSGDEFEKDTPEKADDYKSTAGAEERRGPIVMMVKGGQKIPGPPEFDLGTESAAHGKIKIPDLNDLPLAEILDHDWDDQLGWDPERTLEASNKDEPAEVDPQAAKGLEALTVDGNGEIQRRNRFERNGENAPSLAGPSLVDPVAVTLLQERPEREPNEVLKEVKRSILNLRLDYRENLQLALQANLAE